MKRCLLKITAILFLIFYSWISGAQVTGVKYMLKYNDTTALFDMNLVITGGSATTRPHRTQFNAAISFVIPNTDSIAIVQRFMPLQNNWEFNGTIPMEWSIVNTILSPAAQPQNNFYSVIPSLSPTSQYNNLYTNDTIKLFSVRVLRLDGSTVNPCANNIRLWLNGVDPNSSASGMGGGDFSNGFTMGSATQIYQGNISTNITPIPIASVTGPKDICPYETTTLSPSHGGTWQSLNNNIAFVNDSGVVTGLFPGEARFVFTSAISGCKSQPTDVIKVKTPPYINITGSNIVCRGQTTQLSPSVGGAWSSSNNTIANVSNNGLVTTLSPGNVYFTFTSIVTSCKSTTTSISVVENPVVSASKDSVEINKTISLVPSTGGFWTSNDPDLIEIIGSTGKGLKLGNGSVYFSELTTGCKSANLNIKVINPLSTIVGFAYRDVNGNGLYDSTMDSPLPNVAITLNTLNKTFYTDATGYYYISVPPGSYTTTFKVPYGIWITNSKTRNINASNPTSYVFVGFDPVNQTLSAITSINSPDFKCGSTVPFRVKALNNSSQILNGYLYLDLDPKVLVSSANPFPAGADDYQLIWSVQNILPGNSYESNVMIEIPTPITNNDSLHFKARIISTNGDTLSVFAYSDIYTCQTSNGKILSWPDRGLENFTLRNEPIDYMIRFENPASTRVQKVKIMSMLDEKIDLESIIVKDASHTVSSYRENGNLFFEFNDINLNGGRTDTKNGYVTFQVKFFPNIPDGSTINNSAEITFDGAYAINTNSAMNTIVSAIPSGPLPVTWVSFDVKSKDKKAALTWSVNNEINVETYEIEHSKDGIQFKNLGSMPAILNKKQFIKAYNFLHAEPHGGINYYRIKQVDYDGRYTYSAIKSVEINHDADELRIFPNPSGDVIWLNYTVENLHEQHISILNSQGKIVRNLPSSILEDKNIDISGLPSGSYILQITNDKKSSFSKFVKL